MIDVTPFVDALKSKTVAVFGLGLSGLSTVKALHKAGAKIIAWDDNPDTHKTAEKAGANLRKLTAETLSECACLILAPGVPLTHPQPHAVVKAAQEAGIEILGDIEVLHRVKHGRRTVGLTGTNGKSTTTTLIHHVLQKAGKKSTLGGNIGMPVLSTKMPPKDGSFILELSSYQIDLCSSFEPDISVLLNITPDHIDRHGSVEGYAETKAKLLLGDNPDGIAVIGVDDEYCAAIYGRLQQSSDRKIIPISNKEETENGVYVLNNTLFDAMDGTIREVGSLAGITKLHGEHNKQNTAAAYAVARLHGVEAVDILEALKTYPGLAHRQFPVRTINGVAYINDSKATNAEATAKALVCNNNIYWIVGGQRKGEGLNGLERYVEKIRHAFLIGEDISPFQSWMEARNVPYHTSETLEIAVEQAHKRAQSERGQPGGAGVVLLSPACASFDQFESFEKRGESFTKLVEALEE